MMGGAVARSGRTQRTQIWTPREILLAQLYYPGGTLARTVVPFVVPTPDGRVQVNISILAVPDPGTTGIVIPFDPTGGGLVSAGLWLAAAEIGQASGCMLPVTNLVGSHATPQQVPLDPALAVYAETVLSDCDAVMGELTLSQVGATEGTAPAPNCKWILKTRYQIVSGSIPCDEEWAEIVSKCNPAIRGNPISMLAPS